MARPLNTREVAQRMGVDVRTVQRWLRDGKFPGAFRLDESGRRSPWAVPAEDVDALEQAQLEVADDELLYKTNRNL